MDPATMKEIWQHHSGKIMGVTFGLAIGILIITFGFFRTLFVALCVGAGYVVGKKIDEKEDLMEVLDKFLPPGYHR